MLGSVKLNRDSALYRIGKVKYILLSGGNSRKYYDEPSSIRNDLIHLSVPELRISCDYAGSSTIGSMLRMKSILSKINLLLFHNVFM